VHLLHNLPQLINQRLTLSEYCIVNLCNYHTDSLGWDVCSEGQEEACEVYQAQLRGAEPAQILLEHYRATMTLAEARERVQQNIAIGRSGWADPQLLAALEKIVAASAPSESTAMAQRELLEELERRLLKDGMGEQINPFDLEATIADLKTEQGL